ncbi:aryl-sulfate sulfotransferase [Chelativorans sp. ZYF759]|uniref:ribbon-helix-helix domain-containing protein n=1 Tax=Chelativorans sp. ZYF759 TaxID=2692213 RepID=UPI00145E3A72|nr:ribbon-helix-helix domain-containing protein [Chelativorans sp. ZYF759]NMG41369.1 aryl-sulfate sulfotransferase [Chelativorans sp. ZYF759]
MSAVVKRSVSIRGHRTSISLEEPFYEELERIARRRDMAIAALIAHIDENRPPDTNLSSAIRLYVLDDLRGR